MNQGKVYSQREKIMDDKQVLNLTGLVNIFFLLKFASCWSVTRRGRTKNVPENNNNNKQRELGRRTQKVEIYTDLHE